MQAATAAAERQSNDEELHNIEFTEVSPIQPIQQTRPERPRASVLLQLLRWQLLLLL
jgi:hypothetical protein